MPECEKFLGHAAINYGSKHSVDLAAKRPRVECGELPLHRLADISLGWILQRVEGLDLEFTFAVLGRNIESELPSKPLGTWNLTDTAMLIVVFYGAGKAQSKM